MVVGLMLRCLTVWCGILIPLVCTMLVMVIGGCCRSVGPKRCSIRLSLLHHTGIGFGGLRDRSKSSSWSVCVVTTVNHLRFHRHMMTSPLCFRCNLYPETVLHCLRDCRFARRIWHWLGLNSRHAAFSLGGPRDWLRRKQRHYLPFGGIWTAPNRAV